MEHQTDNIIHYSSLREINRKFLNKVKSVFIFDGGIKDCTLLFTHDDRLFAYGEIRYGQLGLGHTEIVRQPKEIVEFHKIKIDTCHAGKWFNMVKTSSGKLFAWGANYDGQLGCGNYQNQIKPIEVMQDVVQVLCGFSHTAALLQDGTLWSWGANNCGQLNLVEERANKNLPCKIKDNVVFVDCGKNSTAILTNQFEVYIWGSFERKKFNATKVELPFGLILDSFTCGPNSLMLLTVDGKPYHYEKKDGKWSCLPVKVDEPVVSVSNNYVCDSFVFENPFCFKLRSGCVTVWCKYWAIKTTLNSVPDTCALFFPYHYTRTPMALPKHALNEYAKNFNKPFTRCVEISMNDKSIYLDKCVLLPLSSYFVSKIGIQIRNHRVSCEKSVRNKINQLFKKFQFPAIFTYLHTLHKGTDEIDHEWAFKMLELIVGKPDPVLRDQYLHYIAYHKPLTFNGLGYWNFETYVKNNLTAPNADSFIKLIENVDSYKGIVYEDKDEMIMEMIFGNLEAYSMASAKKLLSNLAKLEKKDN